MPPFIKKLMTQPSEKSVSEHARRPGSNTSSFVQAIEKVGVHDHLCLIYKNKKEQFDAIIPFMRTGLERGEKCVYIADENTAEEVIAAMQRGGVDVDAALRSGAFSVASKQETYLRNGYFDPDEMIQFLKEATALAKSEGYPALRVTGEMTSMLGGEPGTSRLLEYESKLNLFFPKYDCLAICQYNYDRFTPDILTDVIHTHPFVVSGNTVCKNFYYVPPEEFLKTKKGSLEVERLLNTLLEREQTEQALQNSEETFHAINIAASDALIFAGNDGRVLGWNPAAERIFGYSSEEAIGKDAHLLLAPARYQNASTRAWKTFQETGGGPQIGKTIELQARHKDGHEIEIELSLSSFKLNNEWNAVAVARDITERKAVETRLKKISALYAALVQCNEAIIRSESREELFSKICRAAVEFGGFKMVWIGITDETTRRVVPAASYGDTFDYLRDIQISLDAESPFGQGPTGVALRERKPFWCQDFQHDPRTAPWHERGERSGWGGSAALPLYVKGVAIGTFTFYAGEKDAFDESTQVLLMEMANNVSYALDVFEAKKEKGFAETEMRNSHERLYRLLNSMGEGAYGTDVYGNCTFVNRAFMQILGYQNEEEVLGKHIHEIIHYAHSDNSPYPEETCKAYLAYRENKSINVSDEVFWRKDGVAIPVEYWSHPILMGGEMTGAVTTFTDITVRKQTQETLERSREALNKAQEIAQIGSWDLDVKKNILTWSDEAYKIFEAPKEIPLTYEKFLECVHPEDREYVDTSWAAAMKGEHYDIEHRIIIDHRIKWVRERAELQFDKEGNPIEGIGTTQDITERRRLEEALQENQHFLENIVEHIPNMLFVKDAKNLNFIKFNEAGEKLLGYSRAEMIGKNDYDFFPKDQADFFTTKDRGIIEGKQLVDIPDELIDTKFLGQRHLHTKKIPIFATDGSPLYLLGISEDITEQKKSEENLRIRSEELARVNEYLKDEQAKDEALLLSIGEGMIATDKTGKVITMNDAAEKILGWSREDFLGKNAPEMIPVMDEDGEMVPPEKHAIAIAIATGKVFSSDTMQYVHKTDGKRTPVSVTVNPVILEGALIGTIAIFRDITKEKELEETRKDLLSLASHQLRTPLSGTKWLIETLQKGIHGTLNKEQSEYLDEIYKINERMTSLVHDMLSVLRMESGITPAKNELLSSRALVNAIFKTLGPAAQNKQIRLRLSDGEDHILETDSLLLRNIIESLIANAINYSTPNNEAVVTITKEPTEVLIAVKDSGIGIPAGERRQIFDRFYRASNAKTFDTRGTGLGLYIASVLAQKIGASLSFESEEGKGSTFYVHIPSLTKNEPVDL